MSRPPAQKRSRKPRVSSPQVRSEFTGRKIRAQTIWSRLRDVLDPTRTLLIQPTDPVGMYIRGGPGAVRAFADVLNRSAEFSRDGLALVPGNLANVDTVGDIGVAIIRWYQANGWMVTL